MVFVFFVGGGGREEEGSLNNFLIVENKHKEEKASERVKINVFFEKETKAECI